MKVFFDENSSKYLALGVSELQRGIGGEHIDVLHVAENFGKGKRDDECCKDSWNRDYSGYKNSADAYTCRNV